LNQGEANSLVFNRFEPKKIDAIRSSLGMLDVQVDYLEKINSKSEKEERKMKNCVGVPVWTEGSPR